MRGGLVVVGGVRGPAHGDAETGGSSAGDVGDGGVADVRAAGGGDVGGARDGVEEFFARFLDADVGGKDDGVEFVVEAEGSEECGETRVPIGGEDDANAGSA